MKTVIFTLIVFISTFFISSCNKNNLCDGCETGTLFYTSNCASIKGYIIMDSNGKTYVFQHDLSSKFQEIGLKVCITYENEGNKPLTADCTQGEVIRINCIEKKK